MIFDIKLFIFILKLHLNYSVFNQ